MLSFELLRYESTKSQATVETPLTTITVGFDGHIMAQNSARDLPETCQYSLSRKGADFNPVGNQPESGKMCHCVNRDDHVYYAPKAARSLGSSHRCSSGFVFLVIATSHPPVHQTAWAREIAPAGGG